MFFYWGNRRVFHAVEVQARLAGRVYPERRESLLCELNCELTGMAKQFSELNVIPKGVAAFAEFSKLALREFNQRHPEVSLLDDDIWLKFDTVRYPEAPKTGSP